MRVVALKAWSNGSVSMEERQIAELSDALATSLIAQGIVTPTALPEITDADNGKVLTANSGVWGAQEPIGKKFIVTLTPTSADYSGTMDKTVAEIDAAYKAGRQIVFRTMMSANTYMESVCTVIYFDGGYTYPSFDGYIVVGNNNVLIYAYTGEVDDGTRQTYFTKIYPLTPAT